jgi:hypothetical protein
MRLRRAATAPGTEPFFTDSQKKGTELGARRRPSSVPLVESVEKGSVPYFTVIVILSDTTGFSCGVCT